MVRIFVDSARLGLPVCDGESNTIAHTTHTALVARQRNVTRPPLIPASQLGWLDQDQLEPARLQKRPGVGPPAWFPMADGRVPAVGEGDRESPGGPRGRALAARRVRGLAERGEGELPCIMHRPDFERPRTSNQHSIVMRSLSRSPACNGPFISSVIRYSLRQPCLRQADSSMYDTTPSSPPEG